MRRTFRQFLGNAFYSYTSQTLLTAGGFLVALKVIDYLGPHAFGVYSTVLAFTSFFTVFTVSSGIDDLAITDRSSGTGGGADPQEAFATAFALRLMLGGLAFAAAVTGARLVGYRGTVFWLIALYGVSMLFSFHNRNSLLALDYIVRERRLVPEAVTFAVTACVLLFKYALTVLGAPLWLFVAADASLVLGISLVLLGVGRRRATVSLHRGAVRADLAADLVRRTLPISASALLVSIFLRVDQVMLSRMMGMTEVGLYSVAVRFVEVLNFVPVIAASLLLPVYSRVVGPRERSVLLTVSFRAAAWGALLVAAGLTLFGEDLLSLLWQDRFAASARPLTILVWSVPFVFMGTINGAMNVAYGLQRYNLVFIALQSLLNVALNLVLIPHYGSAGAAVSTVVTYGLGLFLMPFIPAMRFIALPAWKAFAPLSLLAAFLLYGHAGRPLLGRWPTVAAFLVITAAVAMTIIGRIRHMDRPSREAAPGG